MGERAGNGWRAIRWALACALLCACAGRGGTATSPPTNPIASENALPGTGDWAVTHPSRAHEIEGFALENSVRVGETLHVAVAVSDGPRPFLWTVYRLGDYSGLGGRELARGGPLTAPVATPCPASADTGLVVCHWSPVLEIVPSASWVYGLYVVKLTRDDGFETELPFILRPSTRPELLVSIPTATWEAYNAFGGESLYADASGRFHGRAYQVSYDRPYEQGNGTADLLSHDVFLARWLEALGLDVEYVPTPDLDADSTVFSGRKAILLSGHDEYWSRAIRDGMDAAVAGGTSLLLLGANAAYWQVRFGPSASGAVRRVITCFKQQAPALDPVGPDSPDLTVRFRDPPLSRPESELFGVMSNGFNTFAFPLVMRAADHWALAGSNLGAGDTLWQAAGYEFDSLPNGKPAGIDVLGDSTVISIEGGVVHAQMVVRQAGSALVFAAGGIDFVRLLSDPEVADPRAARIVANVLFRALGLPVPQLPSFPRKPAAEPQGPAAREVRTVAGHSGQSGDVDGPSGSALLVAPVGVVALPDGSLAVLDGGAKKVKRVDPSGAIRSIPLRLEAPAGIAADAAGNLYVSDAGLQVIWRIGPDDHATLIAGKPGQQGVVNGPGLDALFEVPLGLAIAPGDRLLVADQIDGSIRSVDLRSADHPVSTFARGLSRPTALAASSDGAVDVVETGSLRVVELRSGTRTVLGGTEAAGFADGPRARLMPFLGIARLPDGSVVVSDPGNDRLRRIVGGAVTTWAGTGAFGTTDGDGASARFGLPSGMAVDAKGTVYVADTGASSVRAVR